MSVTNASQFSLVLSAVQRTERLPGGEIRGIPNGRPVGGLRGLQGFAVEFAEAEKEFQQGRFRTALDRVVQLETRLTAVATQWESQVASLLIDIRRGDQIKNLEKLKTLKSAQVSMQRLILPTRKSFQDLRTSLQQDVVMQAHARSE
ncbi:MAG: hypothetical protein AAF802_03565 [Planctomycetota bacterium]